MTMRSELSVADAMESNGPKGERAQQLLPATLQVHNQEPFRGQVQRPNLAQKINNSMSPQHKAVRLKFCECPTPDENKGLSFFRCTIAKHILVHPILPCFFAVAFHFLHLDVHLVATVGVAVGIDDLQHFLQPFAQCNAMHQPTCKPFMACL